MNNLVAWLFQTKAIRVCPEGNPFWYTSGTIGPYYINTHFLVGSEENANEALKFIDSEKGDKIGLSAKLDKIFSQSYDSDNIYKALVDSMRGYIEGNIDVDQIDYVSGGERRDWFFSIIIAKLLNKPHITIYKDLDAVVYDGRQTQKIKKIKGAKVLHVADLVTEASSFERAWIPAVHELGGQIKWSVVVVDRRQGGTEFLTSKGIKALSMIEVDKQLFKQALELEYINKKQYSMIMDYIDKPKESMENFLRSNPEFIQKALNADEKTKARANLCIEKKVYSI